MKLIARPLAAALLCAIGVPAVQAATVPKEEVSIPFVGLGHTIRDWRADKDQGLYIQDLRKDWYYARLMAPCIGLDWATSIGFKTGPGSSLDRFSQIFVPREGTSCQLTSLTRSDPPPAKTKKKVSEEARPAAPEVPAAEPAPVI
jgi:hypothetical protein